MTKTVLSIVGKRVHLYPLQGSTPFFHGASGAERLALLETRYWAKKNVYMSYLLQSPLRVHKRYPFFVGSFQFNFLCAAHLLSLLTRLICHLSCAARYSARAVMIMVRGMMITNFPQQGRKGSYTPFQKCNPFSRNLPAPSVLLFWNLATALSKIYIFHSYSDTHFTSRGGHYEEGRPSTPSSFLNSNFSVWDILVPHMTQPHSLKIALLHWTSSIRFFMLSSLSFTGGGVDVAWRSACIVFSRRVRCDNHVMGYDKSQFPIAGERRHVNPLPEV